MELLCQGGIVHLKSPPCACQNQNWFNGSQQLTIGKNEKEYSWHVPAIKFIGMKQLV